MDAIPTSNLEDGLLNLENTWSIGKKSEKISGNYLLCFVSVPDPLYYLYSCGTGQEGQTLTGEQLLFFDTPQHFFLFLYVQIRVRTYTRGIYGIICK